MLNEGPSKMSSGAVLKEIKKKQLSHMPNVLTGNPEQTLFNTDNIHIYDKIFRQKFGSWALLHIDSSYLELYSCLMNIHQSNRRYTVINKCIRAPPNAIAVCFCLISNNINVVLQMFWTDV